MTVKTEGTNKNFFDGESQLTNQFLLVSGYSFKISQCACLIFSILIFWMLTSIVEWHVFLFPCLFFSFLLQFSGKNIRLDSNLDFCSVIDLRDL